MQTFLVSDSFKETAELLDSRRLNKQRVEVWQIYRALVGESVGWRSHPATLMWRGAEHLLLLYGIKISNECTRRGIADNVGMLDRFYERINNHQFLIPWWWAEEKMKNKIIHSHQCNLLRKDYNFYRKFFPDVEVGDVFVTDYEWPVT